MTGTPHRDRIVGAVVLAAVTAMALALGVLLAWFMVEWPEPSPLIARIAGWLFFTPFPAALLGCLYMAERA